MIVQMSNYVFRKSTGFTEVLISLILLSAILNGVAVVYGYHQYELLVSAKNGREADIFAGMGSRLLFHSDSEHVEALSDHERDLRSLQAAAELQQSITPLVDCMGAEQCCRGFYIILYVAC